MSNKKEIKIKNQEELKVRLGHYYLLENISEGQRNETKIYTSGNEVSAELGLDDGIGKDQ